MLVALVAPRARRLKALRNSSPVRVSLRRGRRAGDAPFVQAEHGRGRDGARADEGGIEGRGDDVERVQAPGRGGHRDVGQMGG